jgi:hypothetical protein
MIQNLIKNFSSSQRYKKKLYYEWNDIINKANTSQDSQNKRRIILPGFDDTDSSTQNIDAPKPKIDGLTSRMLIDKVINEFGGVIIVDQRFAGFNEGKQYSLITKPNSERDGNDYRILFVNNENELMEKKFHFRMRDSTGCELTLDPRTMELSGSVRKSRLRGNYNSPQQPQLMVWADTIFKIANAYKNSKYENTQQQGI